jgi:ubiquinone/menaquinone biosynthesis C-methylase UbiE
MTDSSAQNREVRRRTRQFYEDDSSTYDSQRWTTSAGRYNNTTQLDIVRGLVPQTTGSVVEIGAGTGRFSVVLTERARKLILVDAAARMIKATRQRVGPVPGIKADICNLPLADDTVQGLVCLNVLSHVTPFEAALAEIARVMHPDGWALLNFNNLSSLYFVPGLIINRKQRSLRADVFSQWVAWSSFRKELQRAGLSVVEARGHMPLPIQTPKPIRPLLSWTDKLIRRLPKLAPLPFILVTKRGRAVRS